MEPWKSLGGRIAQSQHLARSTSQRPRKRLPCEAISGVVREVNFGATTTQVLPIASASRAVSIACPDHNPQPVGPPVRRGPVGYAAVGGRRCRLYTTAPMNAYLVIACRTLIHRLGSRHYGAIAGRVWASLPRGMQRLTTLCIAPQEGARRPEESSLAAGLVIRHNPLVRLTTAVAALPQDC